MAKMAAGNNGKPAYRKTRLRNGLRVVSESLPGVRSISLGVWVNVGSRNESTEEAGLSHFLEHLVFKGTRTRNAAQIAGSLESLGGSLNAFTTREQTCYTARVLDEHLEQALDVLADLTGQATLTATNMDRERAVICEEIRESQDNPMDNIHDLFAETHWGGHPLGRPIMGSEATIQKMPRARMLKFRSEHYRAESIVIAASGAVSHERLVRLIRQKFEVADGASAAAPTAERAAGRQVLFKTEDINQTQFCLGFPGLPYAHPDRMAAMLLTSYLGGGMSSVLFQKIREQRGLAYTVYAYHDFFIDSGLFAVYLGTDKAHLREAYDLILTECRRVKKRLLSATVLDTVKALVKGHLTIGLESTSARMHRLGRQELTTGGYLSLEQALREIESVSPGDIRSVANTIFDEESLTVATLGPVDTKQFSELK
jgi:predicted Zn-dependent peptidase